MSNTIIIAGAGIAGLTAAIALRGSGHDVIVFERARDLRDIGAGLQIAPNGSRVLIRLGLEDQLRDVVVTASGKALRIWDSGERWPLFDLGTEAVARYGAPYWTIHRGDLHRLLLDAARDAGAHIRTGVEVIEHSQTGAGVAVTTAAGERIVSDALVAADGIHSRVRSNVGADDKATFTGMMAWRGVARTERLPPTLRRPEALNWVGPGAHVIMYPLRGGQLLNFVGIVSGSSWRTESWSDQGTKAECLADFRGWHPDVIAAIDTLDAHFRWALLSRRPLARFAFGRTLLIGDAAHPTLPFLAQGANMAIEDGLVLARCLQIHSEPAAAFVAFERMRHARTTEIVRRSSDQAERFHNPAFADPAAASEYVATEWEPDRVRRRYDWLFAYDADAEPIPEPTESAAYARVQPQ